MSEETAGKIGMLVLIGGFVLAVCLGAHSLGVIQGREEGRNKALDDARERGYGDWHVGYDGPRWEWKVGE